MTADEPAGGRSARSGQDLPAAVLEVGGERVVLESVQAFELWLAERMGALRDGEPQPAEPGSLREVALWLGRCMPRLVARPDAAGEAIDELLADEATCAGVWRELLGALAALPGAYDEYRLLALARYRRHILRSAGAATTASAPPDVPAIRSLDALFDGPGLPLEEPEPLEPLREAAEPWLPDPGPPDPSLGDAEPPGPLGADPKPPELSLTPLDPPPDRPEPPCPAGRAPDPTRLPRGRRVRLAALASPLELRLASRVFVIRLAPTVELVDDRGCALPLREGRNVVGRVPNAEVVIDERYVDVSRRHLIVDVRDGLPVALTDLSSRGTFVDATRFSRRSG